MSKKDEKNIPIAISVQNVSKTFLVPHEKISTLKGVFTNIFKKKSHDVLHALNNVSFEIQKGEFFGIVGRNGSGKSTLLKILAGVYTSDAGLIKIHGAISPFLELGIGFNPELSGRDNIYLNATVLGMTKKEIDEKFDVIVAFSELERFIDQKLKNYSSGMQVRLAFSVSIHANRDILIMDEVLAVGDSNFQSKCIQEFHKHRKAGRTILLVTHNLSIIEQYCDRALLLRNGSVVCVGDPQDVAIAYRNQNMSDAEHLDNSQEVQPIDTERYIQSISFLNAKGEERKTFFTGENFSIQVYFKDPVQYETLNFGIAIFDTEDRYINGLNTMLDAVDIKDARAKGYFTLSYKHIPFREGRYYVKVGIFGKSNQEIVDFLHKSLEFSIFSDSNAQGMIDIDHTWEI